MEYNIKWNGRTIDNTGRHHLRWSARRTRARRYLSCPGGCLEFRSSNCLFVLPLKRHWKFFIPLAIFSTLMTKTMIVSLMIGMLLLYYTFQIIFISPVIQMPVINKIDEFLCIIKGRTPRARRILSLSFIYRVVADFYSVVDDFPLLACYRNLRSVGLASCRWCWQAWVTHGFDFGELVIPLG